MWKDLIKIIHQLDIYTKGQTHSQILKHIQNKTKYDKHKDEQSTSSSN